MPVCKSCGATVRVVCLRCLRGSLRNAPPGRPPKRKVKRSSVVAGVDLQLELDRFSRLPVFGGDRARLVTNPCALHVRRASKKPRRRLAFASYDRHLIHLTAYPGQRPADALETLLHEVVHLQSLELCRHDARFKRTLAQAAYEAFGVDLRHATGQAVYKLDLAICEALASA